MSDGWIRIPCSRAHRLLSAQMDAPLSTPERWRLWFHLRFCDVCTKVEQQLKLMREAMHRLGS